MKKEVKYYNIWVASVEATSLNCNSITGEGIIGNVSYSPETNTLILDNATIDGNIWFGPESDRLKDITITLVGENTVGVIRTVSNTKIINGSGSLKLHRIECDKEITTIIEDCTISINRLWINAISGNRGKLTIRNANLFAESAVSATTIENFKDIELIGCEIVEPVNARIVDEYYLGYHVGKSIRDEQGNSIKKIVITRK